MQLEAHNQLARADPHVRLLQYMILVPRTQPCQTPIPIAMGEWRLVVANHRSVPEQRRRSPGHSGSVAADLGRRIGDLYANRGQGR